MVLAAVVVLLSFPTQAQRGMRGFGAGRIAMGRAGPPMSFARTPQMRPQFGSPRSATVVRPRSAFVPQRRGTITFGHINGGPFFNSRGVGFGRRFDHRFHHRGFLFAFPYYGAYWPSYYGDYGYPYYSSGSYSYDPAASTSYYSDLSGQLNKLDAEVGELRDENDSLRSALDEQHRPAAPVVSPSRADNEPSTVLIFRDGHRTEVQNYAIVGSTVWLLSPTRADKVPLSDLDLDQTIQTNEQRGLSFAVPKQANR